MTTGLGTQRVLAGQSHCSISAMTTRLMRAGSESSASAPAVRSSTASKISLGPGIPAVRSEKIPEHDDGVSDAHHVLLDAGWDHLAVARQQVDQGHDDPLGPVGRLGGQALVRCALEPADAGDRLQWRGECGRTEVVVGRVVVGTSPGKSPRPGSPQVGSWPYCGCPARPARTTWCPTGRATRRSPEWRSTRRRRSRTQPPRPEPPPRLESSWAPRSPLRQPLFVAGSPDRDGSRRSARGASSSTPVSTNHLTPASTTMRRTPASVSPQPSDDGESSDGAGALMFDWSTSRCRRARLSGRVGQDLSRGTNPAGW